MPARPRIRRVTVSLTLATLAAVTAACSAAPTTAPGTPQASERPATSSPSAAASADVPMESALAAPPGSTPAPPTPAVLTSDPLHALTVVDVATGEPLVLGELAAQKPVLLETMAIWCTNCRAQMHNVVAAHELAEFHSLSLDVDPGERPADLAAYAVDEGYDWPFAMADASILGQLRERFGTAVAHPPSMPKILFRTDGSIELIGLGQLLTAEQLAAVIAG
jgi:hypothetical protein